MQTSPGPKLISLTQWENTIIFPSPCIGLLRILSASCLLSYCSQFPNASVPTSKLNLSRNKWGFFLISLRMSAAATQNAGLCLHCFMLLQQWHSKTWWRPCVGCCADAQRKWLTVPVSWLSRYRVYSFNRRLIRHSSSNAIGSLRVRGNQKLYGPLDMES